jgi:primosomal protein N'
MTTASYPSSDLIQVALPLPLDRLFTYRVPAELYARSKAGSRAVVPFGKSILTGIIVAEKVGEEFAPEVVRDVLDLPDAKPLLPNDILALTRWIADYYFCAWGEALKAALPAGYLQAGARTVKFLEMDLLSSYIPDNIERRILKLIQKVKNPNKSILQRVFSLPEAMKHLRRSKSGCLKRTLQCAIRRLFSLSQTYSL